MRDSQRPVATRRPRWLYDARNGAGGNRESVLSSSSVRRLLGGMRADQSFPDAQRAPDADGAVLDRAADRVERGELFKLERHAPEIVVCTRFCDHRVVLRHHVDELKEYPFGRVRMPRAGFDKPPLITIPAGVVGKEMAPLNRRTLRSGRLLNPGR